MKLTPEKLVERWGYNEKSTLADEWLIHMGWSSAEAHRVGRPRIFPHAIYVAAFYPDEFITWCAVKRLEGKFT